MLGTCSSCGAFICRYLFLETKKPCKTCGSVLFFLRHLAPVGSECPTHDVLWNVETGKMLSDDLCDYSYPNVRGDV